MVGILSLFKTESVQYDWMFFFDKIIIGRGGGVVIVVRGTTTTLFFSSLFLPLPPDPFLFLRLHPSICVRVFVCALLSVGWLLLGS